MSTSPAQVLPKKPWYQYLTKEDRKAFFAAWIGVLLDGPWPCCGLIYVKRASRRGVGNDPDEKVFGIFSLRYGSDGELYYAPADPEMQPGVSSNWRLYPERDLILSWEPVDVADLLREYTGESRG